MKNISKAIIEVMKSVKGMEKNSTVGKGQYAYSGTKDQDVKEVFNEALSENGLCILPIGIEEDTQIDRYEDQYKKQKQSVFTKVTTKYLLLHTSGESIELAGYGHGVDAMDKGAGKATTYALKNCLLYTFLTPVGKIDDAETTHSDDIQIPATPPPAKPAPKKAPKGNANTLAAIGDAKNALNKCKTLTALKDCYLAIDKEIQSNAEVIAKKDDMKDLLTPETK